MWHTRALELYCKQELPTYKTQQILLAEGHQISVTAIRRYLKRQNVYRDMTQVNKLMGYVGKPRGWAAVKRQPRSCELCTGEFIPISRTQRWCRACCPTINDSKRCSAYGINRSQFETFLQRSRGVCEICGEKEAKLCIDHDHHSNRVRGLLCNFCNRLLGHYENPVSKKKLDNWTHRADAYLMLKTPYT